MSQDSDNLLPNNLLIFQAAIAKSFQDISKSVSENEFLQILTLMERKKSIVKRLYKVMEDDLFKTLKTDLQTLVTDECMVEGMKKVSQLIEETTVPSNVIVWRPPGDVYLHLRSLDAEKITNECEDLKKYINKIKEENEELMKKVIRRRENVKSIHHKMKQFLNMPFKLSELENTYKFNQECIEKLNDMS